MTAPADQSAIDHSPVTVTGTAGPGDTVDVLAVNTNGPVVIQGVSIP